MSYELTEFMSDRRTALITAILGVTTLFSTANNGYVSDVMHDSAQRIMHVDPYTATQLESTSVEINKVLRIFVRFWVYRDSMRRCYLRAEPTKEKTTGNSQHNHPSSLVI